MTIGEHRRLRIFIATLGFFLAGAVCADNAMAQNIDWTCSSPSSCVQITLNANVQLTKLHPAAGYVSIVCQAPIAPVPNQVAPNQVGIVVGVAPYVPIVNRGYAGIMTVPIGVPKVILANPANRTLNVTCRLRLHPNTTALSYDAVASAAQPQVIAAQNWHVVATGSTITWTQAVTIPNTP